MYLLIIFLSILSFYNFTSAQSSTISLNNKTSLFSNFDFGGITETTKKFIEVSYGYSSFLYSNKNFSSSFRASTVTEMKFGTSSIKPEGNYSILYLADNYFFSSLLSSYGMNDAKISYSFWRLGAGLRKGYGYNINSNIQVIPYYHFGFSWNRGNFNKLNRGFSDINSFSIASKDKILDRFNNVVRFGTTNSAGLQVKLSQLFSLGVEYETDIIFPKHLAFKQFSSFFIELLSQTGIDFFTKGVLLKAIPQGVPIFYFVLKNGLSYLFYSLKKEKMNWPFETEAPLRIEAIKFNLKISM